MENLVFRFATLTTILRRVYLHDERDNLNDSLIKQPYNNNFTATPQNASIPM